VTELKPKPDPRTCIVIAPVEARLARFLTRTILDSKDTTCVRLPIPAPTVTDTRLDLDIPELVWQVIDESVIQTVRLEWEGPSREATVAPRPPNP
jgi:hypothetical protein